MSLKLRRTYQRLLLKLLDKSFQAGCEIADADSAGFLGNIIKDDPIKRVNIIRNIVGDAVSSPTASEGIDSIVNFSAYWRDDWVAKKAALVPVGAKVLDAGAGQCQYKPLFAHTKYHAQDFAQYKGSSDGPLQETWNYAQLDYVCDITSIPVEDGSFDVVLCTEVLEHVPDPISALRELCRVARGGGSVILSAPLGSGVHQEPFHFYGGFSPYFYEKFLNEFGCDIVELKPIGGLMRHVAQEVHRAARTVEAADDIMTPERRYLMMDWMPRLLSKLDEKFFVDQFTVGYLVEARKRLGSAVS